MPTPTRIAIDGFPSSAFGVSLVWISFSYSGWNAAVYIGGEVRDPERNLPCALLRGTGLVMLLYVALNAVFVFAAPVELLAGKLDAGRIAAEHLGGPILRKAISALVPLTLMSSVSSKVMAGPGSTPAWQQTDISPVVPRPAETAVRRDLVPVRHRPLAPLVGDVCGPVNMHRIHFRTQHSGNADRVGGVAPARRHELSRAGLALGDRALPV